MIATPVSLTIASKALELHTSLKAAHDAFQQDYLEGCERFRHDQPLVARFLNSLMFGVLLSKPEEHDSFNSDYYQAGKEVREYLSGTQTGVFNTLKSRAELTSADQLDLSPSELEFVKRYSDDRAKALLDKIKAEKSVHEQELASRSETNVEKKDSEFELTPKVIASLIFGLCALTVLITYHVVERIHPFKGSISDVTICKAAIAGAYFKSSFNNVMFDGIHNGEHRLHYYRRTDGKRWDFTCRLDGNSVI